MRRNERALRGRPGQYDVTEGLCGHVVESSGRPHWAGLPGKWEKFLGRRVGLVGECGWRYTLGPRRGGLHPAASLRARKPGRLRDGPVVSTFGKRDGVRKRAPLMGEGCRNGARRGHRAVHQGQRRPPPGRREVRQTRTGTRLLGPHPKVASGRGLYCVGEGRPPGQGRADAGPRAAPRGPGRPVACGTARGPRLWPLRSSSAGKARLNYYHSPTCVRLMY